MPNLIHRARNLRLMAFDVDGIFTAGQLFLADGGEETKAFDTLDGHGVKMLGSSGVELAIITGRRSRLMELRAANLGLRRMQQGVEDKLAAFQELLAELGIDATQAGYMGDDLVDVPVLRRAGFAVSVPSAPSAVQQHVHYVTRRAAGSGAVREVCDFILRAQGRYAEISAPYRR